MPFLYLDVQHFLRSWLFKISLDECPETDKSKSIVISENLISSHCIIIPLATAFLVWMNVFLTMALQLHFSGLREVEKHELTGDGS